ncbi:hypothetical protein FQR65_LT17908 [Abscondita terminalis]|nr:hypothetical protein FQR65_LT17908 [Abscondita terminalis]
MGFLISYYVEDIKVFSLQVLNERIFGFDFGPDSGSKPCSLSWEHIHRTKPNIRLSASEMLTLPTKPTSTNEDFRAAERVIKELQPSLTSYGINVQVIFNEISFLEENLKTDCINGIFVIDNTIETDNHNINETHNYSSTGADNCESNNETDDPILDIHNVVMDNQTSMLPEILIDSINDVNHYENSLGVEIILHHVEMTPDSDQQVQSTASDIDIGNEEIEKRNKREGKNCTTDDDEQEYKQGKKQKNVNTEVNALLISSLAI